MRKKIMVLLLSVSLMSALIMAAVNPSSVMALAGLSSLDAKGLEKVQAETVKSLVSGMSVLYHELGKNKTEKYVSGDDVVTIHATRSGSDIAVEIYADASLLPDLDYKDIGRIIKLGKAYLEPIFTEKQAAGMCSLLIGDAYAQYRKGIKDIEIIKEFDGITINCSGNVDTGLFEIDLKSTGVTKWPSSKRIFMEMKVLPL